MIKRHLHGIFAAVALVCSASGAHSQSTSAYPAKPIEFVVPGNPGAGSDMFAR